MTNGSRRAAEGSIRHGEDAATKRGEREGQGEYVLHCVQRQIFVVIVERRCYSLASLAARFYGCILKGI